MNSEQMEQAVLHTSRPLKVGINLPTTEGSMAGQTARWADLFTFTEIRRC